MATDVPALRRGLALLRLLAGRAGPMSAAAAARELGVPRSTTYQLLGELAAAGFVTHLPDERRWALGVTAFELGSAYLRHDPLERLGRPALRRLASRSGRTAHLGVLHGRETLYVVKEQPPGAASLVTDVGVRLPAHLTAVGRSCLAHVPPPQVRALFPSAAAFVDRTGRGPRSLPGLRRVLAAERRRGWAVEDGHVTPGFASVAAPVLDHAGRAVAAVGVTFPHECEPAATGEATPAGPAGGECGADWPEVAALVRRTAADLTTHLGGPAPTR